MFTIVCVYNNKKIVDDCLAKSLKKQSTNYELILINNIDNKFKSSAEALNYHGKKVKNKYIIFVHQDIEFINEDSLVKAENYMDSLLNVGVAGVVGMLDGGSNKNRLRNQIIDRGYLSSGFKITNSEIVQTLDECLLIIPSKIFKLFKFDEKICDGWHLYGVDYCLTVKQNSLDVYVLPLLINHKSLSIGKSINTIKSNFNIFKKFEHLPEDYFKILNKVLNKHKNHYKIIYTTCGNYNTRVSLKIQRVWNIFREIVKLINVKM